MYLPSGLGIGLYALSVVRTASLELCAIAPSANIRLAAKCRAIVLTGFEQRRFTGIEIVLRIDVGIPEWTKFVAGSAASIAGYLFYTSSGSRGVVPINEGIRPAI